jgi:hypothetical protein
MGTIQRALPSYLETLNGYVPGLLFTLIVEKRLVSLFGAHNRLRPPFGWKHSDSQSERHQIGARGL